MIIGKKNALICLAAGKSQYPLISKAKEMGFYIISIDQNPNSEGFLLSDFKIIKSTYDAPPIIAELRKIENEFNFIGILNRSAGPPVYVSALISEEFNIPGIAPISANLVINKNLLRQFCYDNSISTPKFQIYSSNDDINSSEICYPIVIKPGLSLIGKKGVSVVKNESDLLNAIEYAKKYSINDKILIEEYIDGEDISFVCFVNNRIIYPVCILDEINFENENNEINGLGFKTHDIINDPQAKIDLLNIINDIINKLELDRTPLIGCFRKNNLGEYKLIEIHLDLGGDRLIEEFYPAALNIDFLKMAIEMSAGIINYSDVEINPTAIYFNNTDRHLNQREITLTKVKSFEELKSKR